MCLRLRFCLIERSAPFFGGLAVSSLVSSMLAPATTFLRPPPHHSPQAQFPLVLHIIVASLLSFNDPFFLFVLNYFPFIVLYFPTIVIVSTFFTPPLSFIGIIYRGLGRPLLVVD
jgi:hypothetical protein